MNILIGTPAYGQMVHTDYVLSLLGFSAKGINYTLATIGNESLITRARNSIISHFYANCDNYSHLLFLDADINLPAEGLQALIDQQKDVIGAAVPLKGYTAEGKPMYNVGDETKLVEGSLHATNKVGTAVMLLSKKAVIALVEHAKSAGRVYTTSAQYETANNLTRDMFDVFGVGAVDGDYISEDFWVCKDLKELGFEIYIDASVRVVHNGMHAFTPA